MKTTLSLIILMVTITTNAQTQKTYILQPQESIINWIGSYTFLMSEHKGTVKFNEGILYTNNGKITGGEFTIDMTSISNPEYEENENGPVEHLRNKDFFDVGRFPVCYLKITSVEYFPDNNQHKFLADLIIKDISKPIEFWGVADGSTKTLTTQFKIDRTRWGIVHDNKIKEHSISEAIEFNVILKFQ